VKFGDDSSTIVAAMEANGTAGKDRGVLDAVMEALEWFSDSRPGDSIILIAPSTGGNRRTNPKSVAKSLSTHRVRLYGLALGPVMTRNLTKETVTSSASQGMAYTRAGIGNGVSDAGDEDFFPLTTNSGGVVIGAISAKSEAGTDRMDDPRVAQFVKSRAQILSNAVQALYRVEIDRSRTSRPGGWSLEMREDIRKSAPSMFILYDHELGPC